MSNVNSKQNIDEPKPKMMPRGALRGRGMRQDNTVENKELDINLFLDHTQKPPGSKAKFWPLDIQRLKAKPLRFAVSYILGRVYIMFSWVSSLRRRKASTLLEGWNSISFPCLTLNLLNGDLEPCWEVNLVVHEPLNLLIMIMSQIKITDNNVCW